MSSNCSIFLHVLASYGFDRVHYFMKLGDRFVPQYLFYLLIDTRSSHRGVYNMYTQRIQMSMICIKMLLKHI